MNNDRLRIMLATVVEQLDGATDHDDLSIRTGRVVEQIRALLAEAQPQPGAPTDEDERGTVISWLLEQAIQAADDNFPEAAGRLTLAAQLLGGSSPAPEPVSVAEPSEELLEEWRNAAAAQSKASDYSVPASRIMALQAIAWCRQHPQVQPVSVAERLPELQGMFERILCIARSSSKRYVGNIELANRLKHAVVEWAALPVPQEQAEEEFINWVNNHLSSSVPEPVAALPAEEVNALWNCCGVADEHGNHTGNIFEFADAVLARWGHSALESGRPTVEDFHELHTWMEDEWRANNDGKDLPIEVFGDAVLARWGRVGPEPEPTFTAEEVELIQAPWSYLESINERDARRYRWIKAQRNLELRTLRTYGTPWTNAETGHRFYPSHDLSVNGTGCCGIEHLDDLIDQAMRMYPSDPQ